jgi:hypothetical protein
VALALLIGREVAALGPIPKLGMRTALWLGVAQFVLGTIWLISRVT